jgi:hypothetical protein
MWMQSLQMQMHMNNLMQNNMQNIRPPNGFRSIPQRIPMLLETPLSASFFLKLKKSDLTIAQGNVIKESNYLQKELREYLEKGKKTTPYFKMKSKKGFGVYDEDDKLFIIKLEE